MAFDRLLACFVEWWDVCLVGALFVGWLVGQSVRLLVNRSVI
jgi:hypothetical protein